MEIWKFEKIGKLGNWKIETLWFPACLPACTQFGPDQATGRQGTGRELQAGRDQAGRQGTGRELQAGRQGEKVTVFRLGFPGPQP